MSIKDTHHTYLSEARRSKTDENVIENVHVCGLKSKNGYAYTESSLSEALTMYDGIPSYINHSHTRRMEDKIGIITEPFYKEGSGVWAKKLTLNPKHSEFANIMWWMENGPKHIGLSHVVAADMNKEKTAITKIHAVEAADIVASPATVGGLFESSKDNLDLYNKLVELGLTPSPIQKEEYTMEFKDITLESLTANRPELVKAISESAKESEKVASKAAIDAAIAAERKLSATLGEFTKEQRSEVFESQLRNATDAKAYDALVADRKAVFKVISKPPHSSTELVEAVTKIEEDKSKPGITTLEQARASY